MLLLVSGCQSGFQDFYQPTDPNPAQAPLLVPLLEGASPQVLASDDVDADALVLLSKNYALIGTSSFNGAYENERKALEQAMRVGATVILMNSRYTNTATILASSPESKAPYQSRVVSANTTYQDGLETVPITRQQVRYDQNVVYLAKRQKMPRFGIFLRDLPPELRVELKGTTGALVIVVVEGSPAFKTNVLQGDIFIALDGSSVSSAEQGTALMHQFDPAATRATLSVIRKGEGKTLVLEIPPG